MNLENFKCKHTCIFTRWQRGLKYFSICQWLEIWLWVCMHAHTCPCPYVCVYKKRKSFHIQLSIDSALSVILFSLWLIWARWTCLAAISVTAYSIWYVCLPLQVYPCHLSVLVVFPVPNVLLWQKQRDSRLGAYTFSNLPLILNIHSFFILISII